MIENHQSRLPIHDRTASTANIARAWLLEFDLRAEQVTLRGPTLRLVLEEFLALAEPRAAQETREQRERSVRELVAQVETAERNRDEDQLQRDGKMSPRRAWG